MQREIRDRIRKLESVLSDIELERQARLEALSANRATFCFQINRIRETVRRLLPWRHHNGWAHSHPVSWARNYHRIDSYSHRHGSLDTCACAHRWWGKCASARAVLKSGWKKHLQALKRALADLAGKAAAALPGIIGSIVSSLLSTLDKTATWLAENLWALAIAVGSLLLVAARDWLARW